VVLVVGGVVVVDAEVGVELDVGVEDALELLPLEPQPATAAMTTVAKPVNAATRICLVLIWFSFIAFPEYATRRRSGSIQP